jgi:hypothetical protein
MHVINKNSKTWEFHRDSTVYCKLINKITMLPLNGKR